MPDSCRQHAAAVRNAESQALAETVDELREPVLRNRRQQPSRHEVNIRARAFRILGWNGVRGKHGRNDFERRLLAKPLDRSKGFHFVRHTQPITGLHFDRGGPVSGELLEKMTGPSAQLPRRSLAEQPRRKRNPSARGGNLLVSPPAQALLEVIHAAARERQVSMRIDKPRHDDPPPAVDGARPQPSGVGLEVASPAHADDDRPACEHGSASHNSQIAQVRTPARDRRAGKRQELRGIAKEKG